MKLPSSELRDLILSLSNNEQAQFIIQNSGADKTEYLKLFEYYIKYPHKEEASLKTASGIKHFERVKHYLHKQVLNYIAQNSSLTSQKEIMNMLLAADALAERSLTSQALQIMHKARKFVEKRELYVFKLLVDDRIHHFESNIGNEKHYEYFVNVYDKTEFKNDIKVIEQEQASKAYLMKRRMFALKNNSLMRNKESINELKSTFANYIKQNDNKLISFSARSRFYIITAYYNQQLGNTKKATEYFKRSADEFENSNPNPADNYIEYATSLHNLMFTYSKTFNFDKIRKVLDKLFAIKPRNKQHRKMIMQSYVNYEGLYCKHHPDYQFRNAKLKLIDQYLKSHRRDLTNMFFLQSAFNLSVNHFINKNFRKAIEVINLCDDLESSPFLRDHLSVVKVYKLVIYFELGKMDLMAFALRNTYRFMLKNMQYYAFEREVITALKRIINISNPKEQNKIWEDTYYKLHALKSSPDVTQVFHLFNFTGWIHCRVNKLDYSSIMNES